MIKVADVLTKSLSIVHEKFRMLTGVASFEARRCAGSSVMYALLRTFICIVCTMLWTFYVRFHSLYILPCFLPWTLLLYF